MNRIRLIGFVIVTIGIVLQFAFDNDGAGFLAGLLVGIGIAFLITGKIKWKNKPDGEV